MSDAVNVGQLRHRVEVQSYAELQDTVGQPIKTWATYSLRWARLRDLRGRELFAAQEKFALAAVEITMRYFVGLNETMRILHKGKAYNILHVDDVEFRHIKYICLCETGLLPNE